MKNELTQIEYLIIFMVWKDMVFSWLSIVRASSVFLILNVMILTSSHQNRILVLSEQGQDVTGALKIKAEVGICHSKEETCGTL